MTADTTGSQLGGGDVGQVPFRAVPIGVRAAAMTIAGEWL